MGGTIRHNSCVQMGHLELVAQNYFQAALNISKDENPTLPTSLGNLWQYSVIVTVIKCWCSAEVSCVSICAHCLWFCHGNHNWKDPVSVLLAASLRVCKYIVDISLNLLFSSWAFTTFLFPPPRKEASVLSSLWWPFTWMSPELHVSLVWKRPELDTTFQWDLTRAEQRDRIIICWRCSSACTPGYLSLW